MLPIFSKDLSSSFIFERFDIFKIIDTKINKQKIGKKVIIEIIVGLFALAFLSAKLQHQHRLVCIAYIMSRQLQQLIC